MIEFPLYVLVFQIHGPFTLGLSNVQLPESLQSLTFGHDFNQSLEMTRFPQDLQSLTLGHNFDQPLDVCLGDGKEQQKEVLCMYIKW